MTSKFNHWKLGLFVTAGVAVGLGALLWLGASTLYQDKYQMHAFFDESVHGLEVGSPVKVRGVTIGTVAEISFAPDQRTVVVDMDIFTAALQAADLVRGSSPEDSTLAVQLVSAGLTGGKYISADQFPPDRYPRVAVPDPLPDDIDIDDVVPSVTSSLKNFEETIYTLAEDLPTIFDNFDVLIEELRGLTSTVNGLAKGEVRELLLHVAEQLESVDVKGISDGIVTSLEELGPAIKQVREATERIAKQDGPLPALIAELRGLTERAVQAIDEADVPGVRAQVGEVLDSASGLTNQTGSLTRDAASLTDEARVTMAQLRVALENLTRVLELLEREPSAMLRGRDTPTAAPSTTPRNP